MCTNITVFTVSTYSISEKIWFNFLVKLNFINYILSEGDPDNLI